MKRTAAAFMLIAGLTGGCMTPSKKQDPKVANPAATPVQVQAKNYMGPHGEPIMRTAFRGQDSGVMRADGRDTSGGKIMQVEGQIPDRVQRTARGGWVPTGTDGVPGYFPGRGILPVPAMGPYGAVAAIGALPPGGMMQPINARTSVRFSEPQDMRITWYGPNGLSDTVLTARRSIQLRAGRHLSSQALEHRPRRLISIRRSKSCRQRRRRPLTSLTAPSPFRSRTRISSKWRPAITW